MEENQFKKHEKERGRIQAEKEGTAPKWNEMEEDYKKPFQNCYFILPIFI